MVRPQLLLALLFAWTSPGVAKTGDLDFGPGPLRRVTLIQAVLERNPEIKTARHALRAVLEQQPVAGALDDLRLSYGLAPLSIGGDARFGNVLSVSQRFPYPGTLSLRERMVEAQAEAASQDIQTVRLDLALAASDLYSDYYFVQRAIEINREHIELLDRFKRIATSRYAAGLAMQQDPIQAEVELAHLEHRGVVLESQREVTVARFNALLHRPPSAPVPEPPERLPLPPSLPEESPEAIGAAAVRDRPELRAQDSTIRTWEVERELKRKELRPDFEATTLWNSMWNTTEHRWMIGASINLPVQRKRVRASIARAEAGQAAARSERLRLEDEIQAEAYEAYVLLRESFHVVELYRARLIPAAADQVQAALSGFETGSNSFLAVIEAERNQRTADLGYQQALAGLHQRAARLDRAVGRMPRQQKRGTNFPRSTTMTPYPERKRSRTIAASLLVVTTISALACTSGREGKDPAVASTEAGSVEANRSLPSSVVDRLRSALDVYEECRAVLAHDRLDDLSNPASRLAESLAQIAAEVPAARPGVRERIEQAAEASRALNSAGDLEAARATFARVSRQLMALGQMDPVLVEGWHAFLCPMVEGFNRWMQPSPELENPFMGRAMPSCGTESDWQVEEIEPGDQVDSSQSHLHGSDEIAYYTCSMHPSVKRQEPGTCPICSMDLTPVTRQELETGVILVDAQRRQLIGVRTAPVQTRSVQVEVRAVGRVVYDEKRLTDVTLKNRGWIAKLHVNEPGQRVEKGQTLFTLYSPELYAAQEEFLTAVSSQEAARASNAPGRADYLVQAARTRLRLWDIHEWQIDRLADAGEPLEHLPIVSPVTGYVVQKNVVEGAAVEPGSRLFRIAGLERVWIEAEVYESDLPLIDIGQQATIDLSYLPGRSFEGRVSFVYPYLQAGSRTGRVRIELDNPGLELKPDMYANVRLAIDRGERVVVPAEAVLYAGPRRLVFLDLGEGRLKPQEIEVGVRSGDSYEVTAGLAMGDTVVTSGNFLIAAESRLKSATEMW